MFPSFSHHSLSILKMSRNLNSQANLQCWTPVPTLSTPITSILYTPTIFITERRCLWICWRPLRPQARLPDPVPNTKVGRSLCDFSGLVMILKNCPVSFFIASVEAGWSLAHHLSRGADYFFSIPHSYDYINFVWNTVILMSLQTAMILTETVVSSNWVCKRHSSSRW